MKLVLNEDLFGQPLTEKFDTSMPDWVRNYLTRYATPTVNPPTKPGKKVIGNNSQRGGMLEPRPKMNMTNIKGGKKVNPERYIDFKDMNDEGSGVGDALRSLGIYIGSARFVPGNKVFPSREEFMKWLVEVNKNWPANKFPELLPLPNGEKGLVFVRSKGVELLASSGDKQGFSMDEEDMQDITGTVTISGGKYHNAEVIKQACLTIQYVPRRFSVNFVDSKQGEIFEPDTLRGQSIQGDAVVSYTGKPTYVYAWSRNVYAYLEAQGLQKIAASFLAQINDNFKQDGLNFATYDQVYIPGVNNKEITDRSKLVKGSRSNNIFGTGKSDHLGAIFTLFKGQGVKNESFLVNNVSVLIPDSEENSKQIQRAARRSVREKFGPIERLSTSVEQAYYALDDRIPEKIGPKDNNYELYKSIAEALDKWIDSFNECYDKISELKAKAENGEDWDESELTAAESKLRELQKVIFDLSTKYNKGFEEYI